MTAIKPLDFNLSAHRLNPTGHHFLRETWDRIIILTQQVGGRYLSPARGGRLRLEGSVGVRFDELEVLLLVFGREVIVEDVGVVGDGVVALKGR
jgi:hypothetical protein